MARKVKFQGFVSVSLTATEKKKIKSQPLTIEQAFQFIVDAAELGYKVSVSFNADKEFFTATLYGNHSDNPNAGYSMSLFHRDLVIAVSALEHVLGEEGMTSDWGERFDTVGDNDW